MPRAFISRTVLDVLIRNKLEHTPGCEEVRALPVVIDESRPYGANWRVPGWTGNPDQLEACRHQIESYLRFLASQFDIPDEPGT